MSYVSEERATTSKGYTCLTFLLGQCKLAHSPILPLRTVFIFTCCTQPNCFWTFAHASDTSKNIHATMVCRMSQEAMLNKAWTPGSRHTQQIPLPCSRFFAQELTACVIVWADMKTKKRLIWIYKHRVYRPRISKAQVGYLDRLIMLSQWYL